MGESNLCKTMAGAVPYITDILYTIAFAPLCHFLGKKNCVTAAFFKKFAPRTLILLNDVLVPLLWTNIPWIRLIFTTIPLGIGHMRTQNVG